MEVFRKRIWSGYKCVFEEKFARLNKVLKKMHQPKMEFTYENERLVKYMFTTHFAGESHMNDVEQIREILVCDVVIHGEKIIKKNDRNYNYLGTVTVKEGVKLVNCHDEKYLEYFGDKFRENVCDHCGTIRKRNAYCLFEADGKVIQIGSTCVEKYFGIAVDKYLNAMGDVYTVVKDSPEWNDFVGVRSNADGGISFDEIARMTDMVTNGFKIWRKSDGDGISTTDEIREMVKSCNYEFASHERTIKREEVVKYWEGKPQSGFKLNVLEMMKRDYCTAYGLGIYVYGIYEAGKDKFTEKSEKVGELNEYFGNVGDKIVREMVLDKVSSFDGMYGTTYVCRFHDADGRKFVWFASNCPDIDCGAKVSIKGTVKKHDEYDGKKQTVLTRCKIAA